MNLSGALAVLTGATEGIGRAIAVGLDTAGARVAIGTRTARRSSRTFAVLLTACSIPSGAF